MAFNFRRCHFYIYNSKTTKGVGMKHMVKFFLTSILSIAAKLLVNIVYERIRRRSGYLQFPSTDAQLNFCLCA